MNSLTWSHSECCTVAKDGALAYLSEIDSTPAEMLVQTIITLALLLGSVSLVHLTVGWVVTNKLKVTMPPILVFPRIEHLLLITSIKGIVTAAVSVIRLSCDTAVEAGAWLVLFGSLSYSLLVFRHIMIAFKYEKVVTFNKYEKGDAKLAWQASNESLRSSVSSAQLVMPEAEVEPPCETSAEADHSSECLNAHTRNTAPQVGEKCCTFNCGECLTECFNFSRKIKEFKENFDDARTKSMSLGEWNVAEKEDEVPPSPRTIDKLKRKLDPTTKGESFMEKYGETFEQYKGSNYWIFLALSLETFVSGIVAAGMGGNTGSAQPTLLWLITLVMLGLFAYRRPYKDIFENVRHICIRLSNTFSAFVLFLVATTNADEDSIKGLLAVVLANNLITTGVLLVSILGSSIAQLANFDRCAPCVARCKRVYDALKRMYDALPFVKKTKQVAVVAEKLGVSTESVTVEVAAEVATQMGEPSDEVAQREEVNQRAMKLTHA